MADVKQEQWKVERKIPVPLIVSVVAGFTVQTFVLGMLIATTLSRLDTVEKRVDATAPLAVNVAKIEVKLEAALVSLSKIEDMLRRPPTVTR